MGTQATPLECIALDVSGKRGAGTAAGFEPHVGDLYRSRSGVPSYWWIVGITETTPFRHRLAHYIVFNMQGQVTGVQRGSCSYLREREKVGHAKMPELKPEWF